MNSSRKPANRPRTRTALLAATMMWLPLIMTINALAQADPARVDVTTADRVAATYGVSHIATHILPAKTPAARTALASNLATAATVHRSTATVASATIPTVPAPGFYGEDLTYQGGKFLKTTIAHPVYVNMSSCGNTVASCWGNPAGFLSDLSNSAFIHLTDQYVGTTASNRYPVGSSVSTTIPLFVSNVASQADIFAVVHAAAMAHGTGYDHIYHVFLPKGVDTCFDLTNICYSPDNPASFVFCAYHGSLTFSDIGHVLLSVEPYQNVPNACAEPAPNPNSVLIDSTNSTLSHEQIESITDPDPNGVGNKNSGWVAQSSSVAFNSEIGDLCVILTSDPKIMLNGKNYQLQGEYSNRYHACAFAP
jgi:hypothetical protein